MSQVTSPVILDSTGQDIVTQLAAISAAIAAGTVITSNTYTTLAGVLQGSNGKVAVKPVDASPTADSTNLVTSGGTKAALDVKANQSQLAYVETGTTASRAYSVGEYFCWNGLLYRAKTAISSGGTFTPGTNCEQVTEGGVNSITKLLNFFGTNEKSAQTDLDTLLESGIYFSNAWTNYPSFDTNRNGTVIVVRRSGNNLVQIYIPTLIGGDLNGIAMRNRMSNQSFTSWFKFSCTTV